MHRGRTHPYTHALDGTHIFVDICADGRHAQDYLLYALLVDPRENTKEICKRRSFEDL